MLIFINSVSHFQLNRVKEGVYPHDPTKTCLVKVTNDLWDANSSAISVFFSFTLPEDHTLLDFLLPLKSLLSQFPCRFVLLSQPSWFCSAPELFLSHPCSLGILSSMMVLNTIYLLPFQLYTLA